MSGLDIDSVESDRAKNNETDPAGAGATRTGALASSLEGCVAFRLRGNDEGECGMMRSCGNIGRSFRGDHE